MCVVWHVCGVCVGYVYGWLVVWCVCMCVVLWHVCGVCVCVWCVCGICICMDVWCVMCTVRVCLWCTSVRQSALCLPNTGHVYGFPSSGARLGLVHSLQPWLDGAPGGAGSQGLPIHVWLSSSVLQASVCPVRKSAAESCAPVSWAFPLLGPRPFWRCFQSGLHVAP